MSKRVQSVKQASHALHDSVRKDVEERKKKFEGQVIPDVSNDLAPYAQLPAAESFLSDKDHGYEQGWEFKTRRTSIGPMDPGTAFHEEESFRHTKRRMTQTTTKTQKYLLSSWRKRVVDEWSGCEVLSAVDFCNT
eukprot:m.294181 g.294181  ORF g.294181 m.294181 type:complete len:135 (+) comp15849_c0_seq2:280-684(+)